ncbi:apolipoprotein N-acyltransferase [Phytoactinopolyspora limicola]|uniref:apolipoprotein N-acyltransferase n=1 Tax=Phytoactinopolyspora limicola TaxID=2715536 RepID=UPI001A9C89EF|nr:apolipoprotein N-acyltransferase [Phytoactinopolyspora limicola]
MNASAPGQVARNSAWIRAAGAAIAGLVLVLAFSPFDLWFLAPLAPAGYVLLVREQGLKRSAAYGFVFGLAFFLPLMWWTGLEVGPIPWILLAILQAAFFVPLSIGLTLVQRLAGWPVWIAAVWVAVEALRGRVPWGGLTWGKLAFSQVDGTYIGLAALGGTPLVSFAVALTAGLLAWIVIRRDLGVRLAAATCAVALLLAGLLVSPPAADGETITVATVQGNVPVMGLDFNSRARVVTNNHVEATTQLARDVRAGLVDQPDIVVWPENSSDMNPYRDQRTYNNIQGAVDEIGVPVFVNVRVPTDDEQNIENTAVLWHPGRGPDESYVKRHPMPFGEYIPMRRLARMVTAEVDRQPRDFVAGDTVGLFDTAAGAIGMAICFEVGFDGIVRDTIAEGGQLLAVQTNNATFRDSPMTEQHLAMSRFRAVEHGRTVIVSALAGVSAIVGPDGTVLQRAELFTQDVLVADVQLSDAKTLATVVGAWPEGILVVLALGVLGAAGLVTLRRNPRSDPEPEEQPVMVAAALPSDARER